MIDAPEVIEVARSIVAEDPRVADMRERVFRMEDILRQGETFECPVRGYFSRGLYAREIFIPKGTILSGKIHKYTNLNIMSMGDLSVLTENGVIRVKAPFTVVSPPGTKRIAYAHEDTVWTTVHATNETDVDKIEEEVIAQSEKEYLDFVELLKLGEL